MSMQIVHASEIAAQVWRNGGGLTRELLAWPTAQAWQVRVSLAQVRASGPFSAYPGVGRYFTVVAGAGVVLEFGDVNRPAREPESPASITMTSASTPLRFDGALAPSCRLIDGPTLDLNLMWRRGSAEMTAVHESVAWIATGAVCGFFARVPGVLHAGTDTLRLSAQALVWQQREIGGGAQLAEWAFQPDMGVAPGDANINAPAGWWLGWNEDAS